MGFMALCETYSKLSFNFRRKEIIDNKLITWYKKEDTKGLTKDDITSVNKLERELLTIVDSIERLGVTIIKRP